MDQQTVDSRLDLIRQKVLNKTATLEELKEAVILMRAGRISASERASKPKTPTRSGGDLLAAFKAKMEEKNG